MKVVELFAGVGGFRLGMEKASEQFQFVWANQWEPSRKAQDAFECYCDHFGYQNHSNEDISLIDKMDIPDHDILVGGFPCQDYSVARTGATGIQGKKGVLWWEIKETINKKRPKYILLENVDRLLKSPGNQKGRDFAIILGSMNDLGYSVEWRVINAADYGFPQRRRRVFIFCYRNDSKYYNTMCNQDIDEIVKTNGFFQSKFPAIPNDKSRHIPNTFDFGYDDLVDISDNFSFEFHNSGVMINNRIHTENLVADIFTNKHVLLRDVLEKDVSERFFLRENLDDWKYLKGKKRIERTHKEGHKYFFSEGAIAFPDPIDKPARTMLTSEFSKNRSTHVILDPEKKQLRRLTPMECERLNGFDDNWTNTGMSDRFRYFCMGNALVVGIVERLSEEIINIENE